MSKEGVEFSGQRAGGRVCTEAVIGKVRESYPGRKMQFILTIQSNSPHCRNKIKSA